MEQDYSQFRFRGGLMKGFLVSSATTEFLHTMLEAIPEGTETARACRAELQRRNRDGKQNSEETPDNRR